MTYCWRAGQKRVSDCLASSHRSLGGRQRLTKTADPYTFGFALNEGGWLSDSGQISDRDISHGPWIIHREIPQISPPLRPFRFCFRLFFRCRCRSCRAFPQSPQNELEGKTSEKPITSDGRWRRASWFWNYVLRHKIRYCREKQLCDMFDSLWSIILLYLLIGSSASLAVSLFNKTAFTVKVINY